MDHENHLKVDNISQVAKSIDSCTSITQLNELLRVFTSKCGFRWYALQDVTKLYDDSNQTIRLTNYPNDFWHEYDRCGYILYDPIIKALGHTGRVLRWRDIPSIITLTEKQTHMLGEANRIGIKEGVSVSIRIPGRYDGLMTLTSDRQVEVPDNKRAWLSFIAPIAYEIALRFHPTHPTCQCHSEVELSPRQMECLIWVARGKSDWETAKILGLSEQTVHRHVESARQKLGVRRRAQMVAKALHSGLLRYRDVL